MKKLHYVYRIYNLKNNKEYIGVRSHADPENDSYMGSSKVLNNLYRLEGVENFKKEIIQTFTTRKLAEDYEASLLTEEFCNNPNTYNIQPTGEFTEGKHGFRKDIWYDYLDEIREKYLQGSTTKELGEQYGCDQGTIRMVIADIKRTNSEAQQLRFSKFSSGARNLDFDELVPEIISLYLDEKKSIDYISSHFGCHNDVIKRRLKENNVKLRTHKESQQLRTDRKKRSKIWEYEEKALSLYNECKNIPTLAREFECDYMTVKSFLIEKKVI